MFFKNLRKISGIVIATSEGNVINACKTLPDHGTCMLNSYGI